MSAMNELYDLLSRLGLSELVITELLARFLREEAFDYVEVMRQEGYSAEDMVEEGNVA